MPICVVPTLKFQARRCRRSEPRLHERCGGRGKRNVQGSRPCHGKRGRWRGPAGDERDGLGLWRSGHGPRVLPELEEVVREDVNKDTVQIGHHGGESVA